MTRARHHHLAFTLVELLIVMAFIALLAGAVSVAMFGVLEDAKGQRTKAQITKIDSFVMDRWDSYRTRSIPFIQPIPPGTSPAQAASVRLLALRELMRIELPDRKSDLVDPNGGPIPPVWVKPTATYKSYLRKIKPTWTTDLEGSECLYLILSSIQDGSNRALDFFVPSEIGDLDGDGMREILDAWGNPIDFLRWAPGFGRLPYGSNLGFISDRQRPPDLFPDASQPDEFDPFKVDPRWKDANPLNDPFLLFPLICSSGSDGIFDLIRGNLTYARINNDPYSPQNNDPYFGDPSNLNLQPIGTVLNGAGYADNIHNHWVEVK